MLGQRWIAVQSDVIDDLSDAVVEILPHPRIDLASGSVTFNWVLVNPNSIDAWDETSEEGTPATFPSKLTPVPLGVAAAKVGSTIRVTFTAPKYRNTGTANVVAAAVLTYAVEYKLAAASTWTRQLFSPNVATGTITLTTSAVSAGTYDVRVASICQGALSPWSAVVSVVI
jgi:hypothetical protein